MFRILCYYHTRATIFQGPSSFLLQRLIQKLFELMFINQLLMSSLKHIILGYKKINNLNFCIFNKNSRPCEHMERGLHSEAFCSLSVTCFMVNLPSSLRAGILFILFNAIFSSTWNTDQHMVVDQ